MQIGDSILRPGIVTAVSEMKHFRALSERKFWSSGTLPDYLTSFNTPAGIWTRVTAVLQ